MAKYRFEEFAINCTEKKVPSKEDYATYIGLEHMDTKNIHITRWGSVVPIIGEKLVMHKGDILFGKRNTYLRRAAIAPHDGIFSAHGMILRPKEDIVDYDFFALFIASDYFFDKAIQISVGSLSPTVNWKDLKDLEFDLPDIKTQKELAKVLWSINDTLDSYKEQLRLCDELVKAQFVEMFGDIKSPKYEIKTLKEITEFIKDGTHNTPTYTENKEEGYKFLSSKDVTSGRIDWSNIKYIPKELHEYLYARIKPQRNDILLAKNGTTGICAVVDTDEVFDIYVSLALLRFKKNINSVYMWVVINSPMSKEQFDSHLKGIGVPNLHLGEIEKTKVIVPPIEIQESFASFVHHLDKSKVALKDSIELLNKIYTNIINNNLG